MKTLTQLKQSHLCKREKIWFGFHFFILVEFMKTQLQFAQIYNSDGGRLFNYKIIVLSWVCIKVQQFESISFCEYYKYASANMSL